MNEKVKNNKMKRFVTILLAITTLSVFGQKTDFYIRNEMQYSENFISEFKKYHGMYETV